MRAIHIDQAITRRDEHSLQLYLNELDGMALISAEEEAELAKKIRAGDQAALQQLVKANLRFVVSCAKKYQKLGLPLADLVSEGNLGLIKAATLFDETRGFKFISYAVWWIRQHMMAALSVHSRMIRLPENMVKATADLRRTAEWLEQRLERRPTPQELREVLYVAGDGLAMDYAFERTMLSLDEPAGMDSGDELGMLLKDGNALYPDQGLMRQSQQIEIDRLMARLNDRERKIVTEFFGLEGRSARPLEDIADELGLTTERARQLKKGALYKLQARLKNSGHCYA